MTIRKTSERVTRAAGRPLGALDEVGSQAWFYGTAYGHMPLALRRYKQEILRLLAEVSFGSGALALIGGTVLVVGFLTSFAGIEIGLQGYDQLANVGVEALSGFISAYLNVRLAAPVIGGIGLIATVGAGFTAQLGAQRVNEEIDALEVMAVPSLPFLITTRILAGFIAIIPLYAIALLASFAFTRIVVVFVFGQSGGAYSHYFHTFLIPSDILSSFIMVLLLSVVIMSIHTYYGYTASGGPAGVGRAVGRAVRLSLIGVLFTVLLASLVLYGNADTVNISG